MALIDSFANGGGGGGGGASRLMMMQVYSHFPSFFLLTTNVLNSANYVECLLTHWLAMTDGRARA